MEKIFSIWLALTPLIVWHSRFEVPKVFWFISGGIVIIFYLILNIQKLFLDKRDKWFLLWIVTLIISGLLSSDVRTAILGGSYRHQGAIFFICLWLVVKTLQTFKKENLVFLYKSIALAVLTESILVISGYELGTLGEKNAVSGFVAIGIYFVYKFLPKWILVFPIMALLLNFSKSAFLSLFPYIFKKVNLFIVVALCLGIFLIKPINNSSPFENREVIWKHSLDLIFQNPIIGYGAESNEKIFDKAFFESGFPLSNLIIDRSHNLFLDITLWSGLVGLIFFLGLLIESYKIIDIERKKVLLSFLIYSMFQPLSVAHWILFILII